MLKCGKNNNSIIFSCNYIIYLDRGDNFRSAFARLGTIHSIFPKNVGIMALTVTATKETYRITIDRLSMNNPNLFGLSSVTYVQHHICS